jgi:hypothetical protein
MRDKTARMVVVLVIGTLAACGPGPTLPAAATATTEPAPAAPTASEPAQPQESIELQSPGPGSTVTSPLQVKGVADPTFEQHLSLRLYRITGEIVAEGSASIEAAIGERGPFAGQLTFDVEEGGPALLQVYDSSARDGGMIHLSSVPLTLAPSAPAEVKEAQAEPERIVIESPGAGETLTGGMVQVSGVGWASFEGTLVVEVVDAAGETVGQQPLIVEAPAMGAAGPFSTEVTYQVDQPGPGRVIVYDPSPAFGGLIHLSSVEVQLQP